MNAKRVNAAADVISAAMKTRQTPTGIAAALDAAQLLLSPKEQQKLHDELDGANLARWEEEQTSERLRVCWYSARRRGSKRPPHEREGLIFRLQREVRRLRSFTDVANEAARVQGEALTEAWAEWRKLRDRVAELEALVQLGGQLAEQRHLVDTADHAFEAMPGSEGRVVTWFPPREAVCARCGHSGEEHHHGDTKCWAQLPRERQDVPGLPWGPVLNCECAEFVAAEAGEVR